MTADLRRWRLACASATLLFVVLAVTASAGLLLPGERDLRDGLLALAPPGLAAAAGWLNYGGTWRVLLPATALLLALSRETRRHWWLWCAILIVAPMIEDQVKPLVGRPRPEGPAPGFPSGHVTAAATHAVILIRAGIQERAFPAAARGGLVLLAVAYVGSVGLARLLLRAHWPSDVLGGLALGTACVAAGAWWVAAREARGSGHPAGAKPDRAGAARAAPDRAGSGGF